MAFITTGLTNGGITTHYRFSYDEALGGAGGVEPGRTNAVIAACENDYNLMSGWFGGGLTVTGMTVQVTTQSNGASWSGTSTSSTIQLKAQGASYSSNAAYLRYLLVAEVSEIFMMTQNRGWFQGGDEGSKGEGLSRFLSGQFLAGNGFLGLGIDADYAVARLWLNSPRSDYVNNAPDDFGFDAINGCTTLFIYYLFHQLGYGVNQIVAAAGATLTEVYRNLTGDPHDPFPLFQRLLEARFPSHTASSLPGPNFDDPWPLGDVAWSGVWRGGNRPYYLWIHAPQSEFVAKWQELAGQNLRLTDIDVSTVGGRQLWSGIWEDGTDGYWLWYDANQAGFLAKWSQLSAQGFRLVSLTTYDGLYAGAFRSGNDGYYLWVDADDTHFLAKFTELAAQGLRLVDFDVSTVNGQRRWAGVWRSGSDGYYLWINADWPHFLAKADELAAQGLRLIGLQHYGGLWAGIWRSGSDAYYLWVDANESAFLAKWGGLANQGLRLIDVIASPVGGAIAAHATAPFEVGTQELAGRSELVGAGGGSNGVGVPEPGARDADRNAVGSGAGSGGGVLPERIAIRPAVAGSGAAGPSGAGGGQLPQDLPSSRYPMVRDADHASGAGQASGAEQASGAGQGGGSAHLEAIAPAPGTGLGTGTGGGSLPAATAVPDAGPTLLNGHDQQPNGHDQQLNGHDQQGRGGGSIPGPTARPSAGAGAGGGSEAVAPSTPSAAPPGEPADETPADETPADETPDAAAAPELTGRGVHLGPGALGGPVIDGSDEALSAG